MFKNNVTVPQVARTATDLHPALPSICNLKLRSENGATNRADSLFGELSVKHSPTKELGGGFRHVVRVDLREQGDIKPAFAYFVIGNHDSVAGEDRAVEALNALFNVLFTLNDDVTITSVEGSTGKVTGYHNGTDPDLTVNDLINEGSTNFLQTIRRLLARES